MKLLKKTMVFLMVSLMLSSCYTMEHVVGEGAQGGQEVEECAWYILFGLVPLKEVDSKELAAGAEDYTITTEHTVVDVIIGIITGIVTITPKTVRVNK